MVGETLFNVLRIGEIECDAEERPLYPPKITGIEILANPFEDIVPRDLRRRLGTSDDTTKKKKKKKPAKK